MKVVIQCAAGKQPDAGSLHAPDGQKVVFVAPPEHAPPTDAGADNRLERGGRGDYAASHARCRHLRPREHEGADGEPEPADPVPGLRGLLPARRARRPGAVRQRRALGSNTRRHEGRARDRTPGVPRAHRLRQRGALGGPELAARPGARRTFARRSRTTRRAASTSSRCSNA